MYFIKVFLNITAAQVITQCTLSQLRNIIMIVINSAPCNTIMIQIHLLMQPVRQSGLLITYSQAENDAQE